MASRMREWWRALLYAVTRRVYATNWSALLPLRSAWRACSAWRRAVSNHCFGEYLSGGLLSNASSLSWSNVRWGWSCPEPGGEGRGGRDMVLAGYRGMRGLLGGLNDVLVVSSSDEVWTVMTKCKCAVRGEVCGQTGLSVAWHLAGRWMYGAAPSDDVLAPLHQPAHHTFHHQAHLHFRSSDSPVSNSPVLRGPAMLAAESVILPRPKSRSPLCSRSRLNAAVQIHPLRSPIIVYG